MKRRFYIALGFFLIQSITLLTLSLTLDPGLRPSFLLAFILLTLYLILYFIGGLSKLFVYLIYGAGIFLLLYFFAEYQFALIVIGTFVLLLNPLSYFENRLAKSIDNPDPIEFQKLVKQSYFPYYDYRAKMKEYYHLPQTRKFINEKRYYRLINIATFLLAGFGIFLSLLELNLMADDLAHFRLESILVFYVVIIIFVSALILYKKGFKSTVHFLSAVIILPMALLVFMTDLSLGWQISIASIAVLATIIIVIWQIHNYFQRVAYHESTYINSNTNNEVHANVLYEPYIFNDSYILVGKYELPIDIDTFHQKFNKLLAYANYRLFFISAYVNTGSSIIIYTQFHKKRTKAPAMFSNFLEKTYKTSTRSNIQLDPSHEIYEKSFYRTDDYIVARAISLGKLMKKIEIQSPIIINMFFYFNDVNNLKDFIELYQVDIISFAENVITIKVEFEIVNVEYLIDLKVREILLNALINEGSYIRITAAWKNENINK